MFDVNEIELYYEEDTSDNIGDMQDASSDEVLVACLNKLGRVDLIEMSKSSGKSIRRLVSDLRGSAILQDPAVFENEESWDIEKGWLLRAQYCCGNLYGKLNKAQEMNERFPGCFEENVTALRKMLPSFLYLDDIHVSPGAPWVPEDIYVDFLMHLLNFKTEPVVSFNREIRTWQVVAPAEARSSVANTMTYGTSRISAVKIFEQTMNAKTVKIYDYTPIKGWKYEKEFNKDATLAAQEKQAAIIAEFNRWIHEDEHRCMRLEECYNDSFTGYGVSPYDGSFLSFPDLNPEVTFYPHQRNAIARILLSKENLLLAHDMGTGKTYEMCAGVHELYRMGLSRKNLIVVPNNVLRATVDAHKYLYPKDRILAVYPKDFTPDSRNKILKQIRDGDYTCIFMAYSSFDMIVMSKEYWIDKMTRQIDSLRNAIATATHKFEKQALESRKERLSKKFSDYILEGEDTPWLTFDKLGIETLVIDEAHNYKNIPIDTRSDNIVGMHTNGSRKCKEMLEKTASVKKVIFATGTPLTNSLADLFVLQTYLQADELRFRGIDSFDMWINTFGERETNFEVDVDSRQLRAMTRFSSFHNLTELMSLFSTVCDFHHIDEDAEELPAFNGYTDILVPKNDAQAEYIKGLSERTELVRTRKVKRTQDNLLKITTDGRLCALDIRLVDPAALGGTGLSKVSACAETVYELYRKQPDTCQVVFSDIGTPKAGFNIYGELKYELMLLGISEHEIAFVHDATGENARAKLFAQINAGLIRVVIGSTQKLGVGVNVQERLVALHHLSVPWRPSDMSQREGRIIRRGNTCEEVYIYRYVTEGSFDSYSWQLLENKQRFISSFLSGTCAERDSDDVADTVLNYAEIKALAIGNPLIKRRVETSNRLERAKIACRQRQKQLTDLREVADAVPGELRRLGELRETILRDIKYYKAEKEGIPKNERFSFGEELLGALRENDMLDCERHFADYQGFRVMLPANMNPENPYVCVYSPNGGRYYPAMDTDKPLGCAMRLDYLLDHLTDRVCDLEEQMERAKLRRAEALDDIGMGNIHQVRVEHLTKELANIDKQLLETEKKSA